MKVLFAIQRFESKRFEDSAGVLELMSPMLRSGLVGEHRLVVFGRDMDYYDALVGQRMAELAARVGSRPVVVWGAGAHTARYMTLFRELNLVALADKDPVLQGRRRFGLPIIAPQEIPGHAADVIVSSKAWEMAIVHDLDRLFADRVRAHRLYEYDPGLQADRERAVAEIRQAVSVFAPDLLVYSPAHAAERLPVDLFVDLKSRHPGLRFVNIWWDYDEAAENNSHLDHERETLAYSDFVIEPGCASRLVAMRRRDPPYQDHPNPERVHFHPTIFDPGIFHPRDIPRTCDVTVMGSPVGKRREWIDRLAADLGERFCHAGGANLDRPPLPAKDYASRICQSRILVNTQTFSFAPQCKGKVREALACGTFLLEEDNPETRAFVPEGCGLVYFSDHEQLLGLVEHYLGHPEERESVARAGHVWLQEKHNPQRWTRRILEALP